MAYRALDSYSVLDYLRATPALGAVLDLSAPLHAREVGDGNLNLVFIVEAATGQSLVVKQALPYLRVAGESWPLTRERMPGKPPQAMRTPAAGSTSVTSVEMRS